MTEKTHEFLKIFLQTIVTVILFVVVNALINPFKTQADTLARHDTQITTIEVKQDNFEKAFADFKRIVENEFKKAETRDNRIINILIRGNK